MKICLVFSAILALTITESLTGYVEPIQPHEFSQPAARQVMLAYTEYFYKYFKALASEVVEGNFFFSPPSVFCGLATVTHGAKGNTKQQIRSVLKLPSDDSINDQAYQYFTANFNRQNPETKFSYYSKYFASNGNYLKPDAQENLSINYGVKEKNLNFEDPQQCAQEINGFASRNTNGSIKEFGPADRFSSFSAELVITSNFDGKWAHKFNPESPKPFYYNENSSKNVPVLTATANFSYGSIPEYNVTFVKLPLENNVYLRWILVSSSNKNGLAEIKNNLNKMKFSRRKTSHGPATVTIPQFTSSFEYDAKTTFQKTGLYDPFGDADFSNFAQSPLRIKYATQKSYLNFNEYGSQAASVFGLNFERTPTQPESESSQLGDSLPQSEYAPVPIAVADQYDGNASASVPVFNFDKSFLALLESDRNLFFIGIVNNP